MPAPNGGRERFQLRLEPLQSLRSDALAALCAELSAVARGAVSGGALHERVIGLARNPAGALRGFAVARLVHVPRLGHVLHLERACSAPGPGAPERRRRLTWRLLLGYGLRFSFPGRLWCTYATRGAARLAPRGARDRELAASCAIDAAVRRQCRLDPPGVPTPWIALLGGMHREVVAFDSGEQVLQIGYVTLRSLLAAGARQRRAGGSAGLRLEPAAGVRGGA
jgi:hypothetical protein